MCALTLPLLFVAALTQAEQNGRIEGDVVDVRGEPIPVATIRVEAADQPTKQMTCDATGHFVVAGLPLSEWTLHAEAPGRYPAEELVDLDDDRPRCFLRVELLDAAPIAGTVRGSDGDPLGGAMVLFTAFDKFVGYGTDAMVTTDAEGGYRFAAVPLGPVELAVVAAGHAVAYDVFDLNAPATRDFRLSPGDSASYRITITGASPQQWDSVQVQLQTERTSNCRNWNLGELWPHRRDDDSIVDRDLPAALRIRGISVHVPHGDTKPGRLEVAPTSGEHELETEVVESSYEQTTPVVVHGRLCDAQGRPLVGCRIAQWRPDREPDVTVTGEDGVFDLATVVSPSGLFSLYLDEDDHVIHREDTNTYHYVIHAGSYFERDQHPVDRTTVADRAALVAGRLVGEEGRPVAGAEVELLADQYQGRNDIAGSLPDVTFAAGRTRADGSFALRRLDGHLGLDLWLRITSPRGIHAAGPLEIAPGKQLQLGELRLPRPAAVEGTILDADGEPRAGIQVCLFRSRTLPHTRRFWTGYTNRSGRFRFGGLPAGEYTVRIDPPFAFGRDWPAYGRVTVRAGETKVVERDSGD